MISILLLRCPWCPACVYGFQVSPPVASSPSQTACPSEQVCWSDTGLLSHWPLDFNRIRGTLLGDYGSKLSTSASLCVLQPWVQRFRGAPHLHRPRGAPSEDSITSRGRNRWFQLEGGATAVWPINLKGKPIICGERNISFLPLFTIWQISHTFSWFCCTDLDYRKPFWDNFSIQVKAFWIILWGRLCPLPSKGSTCLSPPPGTT